MDIWAWESTQPKWKGNEAGKICIVNDFLEKQTNKKEWHVVQYTEVE